MKPKMDYPFIRIDAGTRARLVRQLEQLPDGDYQIAVVLVEGDVTAKQHRYYRGHICHEFARYRAEENQEEYNAELAHQLLAVQFIPEGIESTADLTTGQMNKYIEDCRNWLASKLDIQTQNPDPNWRTNREAVA